MLKKNLTHLIIGFGVLFWFKGMYRILDYYIKDTMENNIIIVILSLIIFLSVDGSLEKIGSRNQTPDPDQGKVKKGK